MKPIRSSLFRLRTAAPALALLALPALTGATSAAQSASGSRQDFSDYRVIGERNIFNPKRVPGRSGTSDRPSSSRSRTVSRSETIALVGTMSYAKGPYAFFDSSNSQHKKVVNANDTIADCKVLHIEPGFVKLECGTNIFDLPVGMQLQRGEEGGWKVTERPQTYESSRSYASRSGYGSDRDRRDSRDWGGGRDFGRGDLRSPGGGTGEATGGPGETPPPGGPPGGEATPPIVVINTGDGPPEMIPPPENGGPEPAVPPAGNQPARTGDSGNGSGGGTEDILERLRRRAQEE